MSAYGNSAAVDRDLEVADSFFTLAKNGHELNVSMSRDTIGSEAARLYAFATESLRAAKDDPSLRSRTTGGNDWPSGLGNGHPNEVWISPPNTYEAALKVAYWLGVASRYGYPLLLTKAQQLVSNYESNIARAGKFSGGPGFSTNTSEIQKVITDGQNALTDAGARTDARLTSVYKTFGVQADAKGIQQTQQQREEASPTKILTNIGEDITGSAYFLRGLATGERPPGMSDADWFVRKWGTRLVIGAVGVGALLWVGRPYVSLAMAALEKPATRSNRKRKK
jgi:hypothetical protein